MRHLWSLIAGLVAAPLSWVLLAAGQDASSRTIAGWAQTGSYRSVDLIEPAAYLLVAGIVLGLIGTLGISPAGALTAGLLMYATYAAAFIDPFAVRRTVPNDWALVDRPIPLHVPLDNGTLAVLGALLLVAPFSAQRWRRWSTIGVPAEATSTADESVPTDPDGPSQPSASGGSAQPDTSHVPWQPDASQAPSQPDLPAESPPSTASNHGTGATAATATTESRPDTPSGLTLPGGATATSEPTKPVQPEPLTAASVAVPGPAVTAPTPPRRPEPDEPPSPGGPAPTDPGAPTPEQPVPSEPEPQPVPSARLPTAAESPWAAPPGSIRRSDAQTGD